MSLQQLGQKFLDQPLRVKFILSIMAVIVFGGVLSLFFGTRLEHRTIFDLAQAGEPDSLIHILDLENRTSSIIPLPEGGCLSSINVYFDGRIIAGLSQPRRPAGFSGPNLLIIELGQETFAASGLAGQARGIKDCLTMGPRIISCGQEGSGQPTLRVWGTEFYVRTELSKLAVRSVWPQ